MISHSSVEAAPWRPFSWMGIRLWARKKRPASQAAPTGAATTPKAAMTASQVFQETAGLTPSIRARCDAEWDGWSEVLGQREELVYLRVAQAGEDCCCSCAEGCSHAPKVFTHCLHCFARLLEVGGCSVVLFSAWL